MRIKPSVGQIVGQTDDCSWGQVLVMPGAYGVVEVKEEIGGARRRGIELLTKLTHKLTDEVVSLHSLELLADVVLKDGVQTVILLVPVGRILYVATRGIGRVYLKRGDKLALLSEGNGGISGEVQVGDTLLLVSRGFLEALQESDLFSVFDHLSALEVAEKLTLLLHEKTNGKGAAALVFQVSALVTQEYTQESDLPKENPKATVPDTSSFTTRPLVRIERLRAILLVHPQIRRYMRVLLGPWRLREKKRSFLLVIFLVAFFLISVVAGIWKQSQVTRDKMIEKVMAEARFAFEEGTALLDLNAVKSRERLREAKLMLEPFEAATSEKSREGREVRALSEEISKNLQEAMKKYSLNPTLFYDVTLLRKGAVASGIAVREDVLAILDKNAQTVYTVLLPTKSGQMIASGGDILGLSHVATGVDTLYVVGEKGVVQVLIAEKKQNLVAPKLKEWGEIRAIVTYGGNVYLLDTAKSRIWKYTGGEKGFSEIREYLTPDNLPDLSLGSSLAIDGSLWVGTEDGRVLKFTQGKEDSLRIQGVDPPFGQSLRIFTDDTLKNLYILDSQNRRVVVLEKDGIYNAQYLWDEALDDVADFVVSERHKKILLLAGGKIFEIAIQ